MPIGAVVVREGEIVARGQNRVLRDLDPTAHAEIVALRAAAAAIGNYRLPGCTLYVTLEPCAMCAGAMIHARLDRLVFAAADPKAGAAGSVLSVLNHPQLNHQMQVEQGILGRGVGGVIAEFLSRAAVGIKINYFPRGLQVVEYIETCSVQGFRAVPTGL